MLKSTGSVSIPLRCTTCGHRGRASGSIPGRTVNCPVCDERLIVPTPPPAPSGVFLPATPLAPSALVVAPPVPPPPPVLPRETLVVAAGDDETGTVEHVLDCRD